MDQLASNLLYCQNCGQLAGFQTAAADDVRTMEELLRKKMDDVLEAQRNARFALSMLMGDHVQNNLFRLGCIGSDDVKMAISSLKLILPNE